MIRPMQHDAEWLLQHERIINDLMVEKARRGKPRGKDTTRVAVTITLIPTSTDEDAAAERAMRRVAARTGATKRDLTAVLEALGLTKPNAEPAKPARVRSRAVCHECGRSVELNSAGRLPGHSRFYGQPSTVGTCEGSRRRPQVAA